MSVLLAIDPGSTRSGWALLEGEVIHGAGDGPNDQAIELISPLSLGIGDAQVLVETQESWGGYTHPDALATMRWVGRFEQAAVDAAYPVTLLRRRDVMRQLNLGRIVAGKADAAVRAFLIDRWGGGNPARKDHPLHAVTGDAWAALALAVAWQDGAR